MAQDVKNDSKRLTEEQRLHYIGFEVFPGKPGELFKSDAERQKLVEAAKAKRASGQIVRDDCMLLDERVSKGERLVMTIAALVTLLALLLPWYSVYNEVPIAGSDPTAETSGGTTVAGESSNEEIITMAKIQKRTNRVTTSTLGIEGPLALGSASRALFGSGIALMLTSVLFLLLTVACIALPVMTLKTLYAKAKDADQWALGLKKNLRYNWIPLLIFGAGIVLSLLGGSWGFNAKEVMSSLGSSYGMGAYLGSLTYGFYIAIAGSTMLALKGIEI
jgi:hypothetical protein